MSPFAPFDAQTQVLLIDDDPHLRQALRQTLDLAGLKVATLDDARQLDTAQCKDWPGWWSATSACPASMAWNCSANCTNRTPTCR